MAVLAYLWLSKLVKNEMARLLGTLAFTFCGWMMFWLHFPYFMDMFIYLALILYLSEEILENRKKLLFSITIALIGILSLYQLYMITWLLFIYLMCRYFMINEKFVIKDFLSQFFKVLGHYLLGICLGAIIIVPSLLILTSTNRISIESSSLFSILNMKDILRTITSVISPVSNDYDYNLFFSSISNGVSDGNTVYSYTTLLFPLLLPQLFFIKYKGKKVFASVIGILYLLLLFKFSYYLFNGNESIRWSFFFAVFNCMALAYILDNRDQWNKKALYISGIFIFSSIIVLFFLSRNLNLITPLNRQIQKYLIPCLLIVLTVQFIALVLKKDKLLIVVAMFEILVCFFARIYNGNSLIIAYGKEIWYYQDLIYYDEIMDSITAREQEDSFYRMEFNNTTNLGHNLALSNDYNGFSSYISIYNYYTTDFLMNRMGTKWYFGVQPSKFMIKNVLGNKYLVLEESDEAPYGYSKVDTIKNKIIYENDNFLGFGYATSNVISRNEVEKLPIFLQDYIMMQGIIVDKEIPRSFIPTLPLQVEVDEENKSFKPDSDLDGYYFIVYSLDDPSSTCRLEMYYDANNFDELLRYEVGYQVIKPSREYNDVFTYCTSENNPNHYSKTDIYWVSFESLDKLTNDWNNYDLFTDVIAKGDKISASIDITQNTKVVSTAIAFDPGWKVYADEKEVEVLKTNLGFVGFELGKYITFGAILLIAAEVVLNTIKKTKNRVN